MFGFAMSGVAVNRCLGRGIWDADKPPLHRDQPSQNKPSRARKKQLMAAAGVTRSSDLNG